MIVRQYEEGQISQMQGPSPPVRSGMRGWKSRMEQLYIRKGCEKQYEKI